MNIQLKINELQKEVESLKNKQKNCTHDWDKSKYAPETVKVQDDWNGYEEHGSDRWPKLSFHDEKKPRWSRECKQCGIIQYTYDEEIVSINKKPKFID